MPAECRLVGFVANAGAAASLDDVEPDISNHDFVMGVLRKSSSAKVLSLLALLVPTYKY